MSPRISLFACIVHLLTLGVQAQQITFRPNQQPGDEYQFDQSMTMQMNLAVTQNGQPQQVQQNMSQNRAGVVKVIAAQNGEPIKATLTFEPSSGGFMEMVGQGRQPQPFALAGQTVTVTQQPGGGYKPEGNVPAEAASEIDNYVKIETGMFPKIPVSPGDTWDVAPEEFGKAMQMDPSAKGSAKGKLVSVENVGGRQVADVEINLNITGQQPGAGQMTMQMSGIVKIDVASGRTVGGSLAGPMTIAGQPQPGVDVKGEGKLNFVFKGKVVSQGVAEINGGNVNPNPNPAPNPFDTPTAASFAGQFIGEKLAMEIKDAGGSYEGTITMKGKTFPFTANANGSNLAGKFKVDTGSFDFTAVLNGDQMTFKTGSTTYDLKRKSEAKNPLDQ